MAEGRRARAGSGLTGGNGQQRQQNRSLHWTLSTPCRRALVVQPAMYQRLYINIDHVATLRQARRTVEPDPVLAATECENAGADGITPEDAVKAADMGADGIVVSNHGGRQLDGTLSTARALPPIASAVKAG